MNPFLLIKHQEHPFLRLDLDPQTGERAGIMFLQLATAFESGIEQRITFDPGYTLQKDECFEIHDFPIDENLLNACQQPLSAERVEAKKVGNLLSSIKGVVGYDFSDGQRKLLFQNFDLRRVLMPSKRFAVWQMADASTFHEMDKPVIVLEGNLSAIWTNGVLQFKNFNNAKQILNLSGYFTEATDEQLGQFVSHIRLMCENRENFIKTRNQWERKKIALILRSGILNNVNGEDIQDAANSVKYNITMDGDKIVLPADKKQLRLLLQFLDEDIYRGPISQRCLLSSGKRLLE